jgi:hypothetical protein
MKKIFLILFVLLLSSSCKEDRHEIIITPNESNGNDAIISNLLHDKNFYDEPNIHLYTAVNGDTTNINRVLINFDEIPRNAVIDSAFLNLKFNIESIYGEENYGENQFVVSRVISPWKEEDVTWDFQPIVSPFNKVYCDRVELNNDPNRINVTKLTQEISDDYDNSYGFQLKFLIENQNAILILASSNNKNKDLRPSLKVYYRKKQQ